MSEANSNTYTIMNNPLLQDTDVIEAAAGVIQDVLDTMDSYVPVEVNTFADWAYDAGDIVTIVKDGVDYVMPIFTNALNWNGGSDVTWQSSGNPEREIPDAPQRQSYGYGTAITQVETDLTETQSAFRTYMEQTDTYISLIADETDIETAQLLSSTLFKITSASITGLVEKVGAVPTGENLYSLYQQDAGMIALVVGTGSGGNYIKAASIVTAINDQDGTGQVMIDAGQITLNGETTITGTVTIDGTDYYGLIVGGIEADGIYCKDLYIPSGQGTGMNVDCEAHFFGNVFFEGDYVFGENVIMTCESMTTGGLTVTAGEGQGSYSLTPTNVPGMVTDLQLLGPTNNVYTLQKKTVGNTSWANVGTFSRATQLGGVWGSGTGVLTVTATPQGDQYVTNHYIEFDGNQSKNFTVSMKAQSTGESARTTRLEKYCYLVASGSGSTANVYAGPNNSTTGAVGKYPLYLYCDSDYAYISTSTTAPTSPSSDGVIAYRTNSGSIDSITFDAVDQGDPSYDVNDQYIYAYAKNGSTVVLSGSQLIHMTEGNWNSGGKAVNVRLNNSAGTLVTRLWAYSEDPSCGNIHSVGTNPGSWRTYCGSLSKSQIALLQVGTCWAFTVSVNGLSKEFYFILDS